jgi:hypothetical protein
MHLDFSNKVKTAVDRVGGPTKVSLIMGCSGSAVHAWIRNRKVPDIDRATKLAELAGMQVREVRPCR